MNRKDLLSDKNIFIALQVTNLAPSIAPGPLISNIRNVNSFVSFKSIISAVGEGQLKTMTSGSPDCTGLVGGGFYPLGSPAYGGSIGGWLPSPPSHPPRQLTSTDTRIFVGEIVLE